uniref:FGF n=1 Tax=Caenorhabditis japonica TaxID=281687 RepID=A0A8R1HVY6_CAEJA
MAVPAASSIVSYGGAAATSNFLSTPVTPFLAGFYSSNFVNDRINSCAPYRVDRIRKNLQDEEEQGYPPYEDRRRGALFCRSGTWLEMLPIENSDGSTPIKVRGTKTENSKYSIVEFISVAMSLVSIRGVETKNFICMDPSGKLYATPTSNYSTECVFVEEMMENYYNLYASCAYGSRNNPW